MRQFALMMSAMVKRLTKDVNSDGIKKNEAHIRRKRKCMCIRENNAFERMQMPGDRRNIQEDERNI